MTSQFIASLHSALTTDETFRLDLTRKGDSMDVMLTPILNDSERDVPDEAKAIRTALSMPLVMSGMTLEELSAEFDTRLQGFSDVRATTLDAYTELLAKLKDATATAKNTKPKAKAKTKPKEPAQKETVNSAPPAVEDKPVLTDETTSANSGDGILVLD